MPIQDFDPYEYGRRLRTTGLDYLRRYDPRPALDVLGAANRGIQSGIQAIPAASSGLYGDVAGLAAGAAGLERPLDPSAASEDQARGYVPSIEDPRVQPPRTLPTPPVVAAQGGIEGPRPGAPPPRRTFEDSPIYQDIQRENAARAAEQPKPAGQVNVTMGGRTYSYGGGAEGGAPRAGLGRPEDEALSRIPGDSLALASERRAARGAGTGGVSMLTGTPEQQDELRFEAAGRARAIAEQEAYAKDPFAKERVMGEINRDTARVQAGAKADASINSPANKQAMTQTAQQTLIELGAEYRARVAEWATVPDESPKKKQALAELEARYAIDTAPHRATLGMKGDEFNS